MASTVLEQVVSMYSLADKDIKYWKDWAMRFIECCQTQMGWEVVRGPGTSMGSILGFGATGSRDSIHYNGTGSSTWDCDWTQENGIYPKWQNTTVHLYYSNLKYPLYKGWFYQTDIWPANTNSYGIDSKNGRFDFIVYTGMSVSGEKIGFRVKFPVCSTGYSTGKNVYMTGVNILYTTPVFSVYSSTKGNIGLYYNFRGEFNDLNDEKTILVNGDPIYDYIPAYEGYFSQFGAKTNARERYPYNNYQYPVGRFYANQFVTTLTKLTLNQEDIDIAYTAPQEGTKTVEQLDAPKWTYEFQESEESGINQEYTGAYGSNYNSERMFSSHWRNFNKFHYQFSESGDTAYLCVSNDIGNEVGIEIISTSLENGEKALFIDGMDQFNSNVLFNTGGFTNTYGGINQTDGTTLVKRPLRPYKQVSSSISKFALSKALLPSQNSFCKDLYYVTKRDTNELIKNNIYIVVKDKDLENRYFRIIPFGSQKTYEVEYDNTTLLAFPIVKPEEGV